MTEPQARTDVCVIGAGPAGALVADELARDGADVVVLDAGPRFDGDRTARMERAIRPGHHPDAVWDMGGDRDAYTSTGPNHYPLNAARVKGIGGSTLHWQGMVMRLHETDFATATDRGVASDWPLGYEDLREYYARAESALAVAGDADNPFSPPRDGPFPMSGFGPSYSDSIFADACERLGIAMHSVPNARNSRSYQGRGPCVAYGTCQPVCPSGAKYSADVTVDAAIEAGATVISEATVTRLEHGDEPGRLDAAVYVDANGETRRQEARRFVLAAGGVEIPRLLLLSRSTDHPDGLANSSGVVGRYFHDHLYAGMGGLYDGATRQNHVGFVTSESHQFYETDDPDVDAIKLEFSNYAGPSPVSMALTADDWGDAVLEDIRSTYGRHLDVGALCEQLPREDNYVGLDPSRRDAFGNPVPAIHWRVDDRTKRTLARANRIQRRILRELDVEPTWRVGPDTTGPAFHHMGTTRMGTDPSTSVVDPSLRAHDVENLYVASSSVFVTGGAMNPTLTIAALALRTAETVAGSL